MECRSTLGGPLTWLALFLLFLVLGLGCPGSSVHSDPVTRLESNDGHGSPAFGGLGLADEPFVELPAFFDWRQNDGNYMTPARSQNVGDRTCSSCWIFASVAAVEATLEIQAEDPDWNPDLAEQSVLSCSSGSCDPDTVPAALQFMASDGVADESCLPYEADDAVACDEACAEWDDEAWFVDDWSAVEGDERSIKAALLRGPVIAKMQLYTDFLRYDAGVYEHGDNAIAIGAHFVVLTGWDDDDGAWIGKNSYGDEWGEDSYEATGARGWFRIAFGEGDVGSTAYRVGEVSSG